MPEEIISAKERARLLNSLHRYLFWVGEKIPEEVEIEGRKIRLHELIWKFINKPDLTDEDKELVDTCIGKLSLKELECERKLEQENLTPRQAKEVFDKTAGLLRAIMDLRELETYPEKCKRDLKEESIRCKVDEAKEWINFLDSVKK